MFLFYFFVFFFLVLFLATLRGGIIADWQLLAAFALGLTGIAAAAG